MNFFLFASPIIGHVPDKRTQLSSSGLKPARAYIFLVAKMDGRFCTFGGRGFDGLRVLGFSGLTLRWMFETTVADGTEKLRLQKEVAETSRVNTNITAFLVDVGRGSELALLAVGTGSGGLVGADILIGIVDKILLVRHVDVVVRCEST